MQVGPNPTSTFKSRADWCEFFIQFAQVVVKGFAFAIFRRKAIAKDL
jgi:hypothetical protein